MSNRFALSALLLACACGSLPQGDSAADDLKAPSALLAKGANHQISLKWKGSAKAYGILRGDKQGGPYAQVGQSTTSTFVDKGLAPAATYFYVVQVLNSGSVSGASNEAYARTAPGAVTVTQNAIGGAQASLAWAAVPGATDYVVSRATAATRTQVGATHALSGTFAGLPQKAVSLVVQARNESGPGDDSAAVQGDASIPAVTGTNLNTWVTEQGDQDRMDDASPWKVVAYVQQHGGQFQLFEGFGTADGRYTVPGVPQGPYYLNFGGARYTETTARDLDIGSPILGRFDEELSTQSIGLQLDVQGLAPWQSGYDLLQLTSQNAGIVLALDQMGAPTQGSTSLSGTSFSLPAPVSMVDAAKRDTAVIAELPYQALPGMFFNGLDRVFTPAPFSMTDGATVKLSGSFTQVPQRPLALDFRRSEFRAFQASVHPQATQSWDWLLINAQPEFDKHGRFYAGPELSYGYWPLGTNDVSTQGATYGNPYAGYAEVATLTSRFTMKYALPGLAAVSANGTLTVTDTLDALKGAIEPRISPPQRVQLNGLDAQGAQLGKVGTSPVITWAAPALGNPTTYTVNVWHLKANGAATASEQVLSLVTRAASATIPPGVLVAGETYYAYVKASVTPGFDLTVTPYRFSKASGTAGAFTSAFTP